MAAFISFAGAESRSGTIGTDERWDLEGSPYTIDERVDIPEGVSVTVDAGVRILLADLTN